MWLYPTHREICIHKTAPFLGAPLCLPILNQPGSSLSLYLYPHPITHNNVVNKFPWISPWKCNGIPPALLICELYLLSHKRHEMNTSESCTYQWRIEASQWWSWYIVFMWVWSRSPPFVVGWTIGSVAARKRLFCDSISDTTFDEPPMHIPQMVIKMRKNSITR